MIEASGRGTIVPQKVCKFIFEAAHKNNNIPCQIDILSIPTRYIHAPTVVFNINDIESAVNLAVETIKKVMEKF